MEKQQYFRFAEQFFKDCIETSKKKNADYTSNSGNPFANFTASEVLGVQTEKGFLTRMMDKMMRISSFVNNGQLHVRDESVIDTLQDLSNYCCLMAGYIQSKKDGGEENNKIRGNINGEPESTSRDKNGLVSYSFGGVS